MSSKIIVARGRLATQRHLLSTLEKKPRISRMLSAAVASKLSLLAW